MTNFPLRYIPKRLNKKDTRKIKKELNLSRKLYKRGKYYTRKKVRSFKSKPSKHIVHARKIYGIKNIAPTNELANKTGCSVNTLKKIVSKGEGAYFSSGSRPNQTAQSWGIARLASALTSGKSAAIDYNILHSGCKRGSKGYKSGENARKKYGYGKRKVPKVLVK